MWVDLPSEGTVERDLRSGRVEGELTRSGVMQNLINSDLYTQGGIESTPPSRQPTSRVYSHSSAAYYPPDPQLSELGDQQLSYRRGPLAFNPYLNRGANNPKNYYKNTVNKSIKKSNIYIYIYRESFPEGICTNIEGELPEGTKVN